MTAERVMHAHQHQLEQRGSRQRTCRYKATARVKVMLPNAADEGT